MPFKIAIQAYGSGEVAESDVVVSPYGVSTSAGPIPKLWDGSTWKQGKRRVFTSDGWKEESLEDHKTPVVDPTGTITPGLQKIFKDGEWVAKPKKHVKTVRVRRGRI